MSRSIKKDQTTITLPPEVMAWLDKMVEERIFANRSHGIELALMRLKNEMDAAKNMDG
jgi:Arc/MetJ-type ribon-helix-helix transcriptional regulator